jgi:hypothetical protein
MYVCKYLLLGNAAFWFKQLINLTMEGEGEGLAMEGLEREIFERRV